MGIRFFCHACDKRLHVKAFLAGKRGICPHCGTKVDIPWQSVTSDNGQGPEASTIVRESIPSGAANGASPSAGDGKLPVTGPASTFQASAAAGPPSIAPANTATSQAPSTAGHAPIPGAPNSAAVSIPVAKATSPSPTDIQEPANPIDEAPGAVWYVRPPSGGQFGPASGEIMKKWVDEGRVSADSLVWREGWADWQSADSLFANLGGAQNAAPPAQVAVPAAPAPAPFGGAAPLGGAGEGSSNRTYGKRRGNNSLAIVMVVLLTLASLGLFGVLIAVIRFLQ